MRIFLVIAFGEVLLDILQRLDHEQIDKLGFIKIKIVAMLRIKWKIPHWEEIFANHISDKRLLCRIHIELAQLNCKNICKV